MESNTQARLRARDAAMCRLNRITAGVAFAAVAGVGVLSAAIAYTIPGNTSSSQTATTATSNSTSSTSSSTSAGLQSSSTGVTSSSGSAVAVSGGSR